MNSWNKMIAEPCRSLEFIWRYWTRLGRKWFKLSATPFPPIWMSRNPSTPLHKPVARLVNDTVFFGSQYRSQYSRKTSIAIQIPIRKKMWSRYRSHTDTYHFSETESVAHRFNELYSSLSSSSVDSISSSEIHVNLNLECSMADSLSSLSENKFPNLFWTPSKSSGWPRKGTLSNHHILSQNPILSWLPLCLFFSIFGKCLGARLIVVLL